MSLRLSFIAALVPVIIAGCGGDDPSSPGSVRMPTTLVVKNELLNPVKANVNGANVGTVPPGTTASFELGIIDSLLFDWDVVAPVDEKGEAMGDMSGGVYSTIRTPDGTRNVTIDYKVGSSTYFTPEISNTSGGALDLVVNAGLDNEQRPARTIADGARTTGFGYYRMYTTTVLQAFVAGGGYTGKKASWEYGVDFTASKLSWGSGRLSLAVAKLGRAGEQEPEALGRSAPAVAPGRNELQGERAK